MDSDSDDDLDFFSSDDDDDDLKNDDITALEDSETIEPSGKRPLVRIVVSVAYFGDF